MAQSRVTAPSDLSVAAVERSRASFVPQRDGEAKTHFVKIAATIDWLVKNKIGAGELKAGDNR